MTMTMKKNHTKNSNRIRAARNRAKLTEKAVAKVRAVWNKDTHPTMEQLAKHYKVAVPTISHVIYGLTWRDVKPAK